MEKETPKNNGWKCGNCGEEIEVTPLTFVNPHICKETPTEEFDSDKEIVGSDCMCVLGSERHNPECEYAEPTPTEECPDCKCTNLVSDQCKGECLCHHPELTPTEDTVVHPKTNLIVDYLDNAMGVECDNADWTYINEILLSHDAELRRKIEGTLLTILVRSGDRKTLDEYIRRDAVLALLNNK